MGVLPDKLNDLVQELDEIRMIFNRETKSALRDIINANDDGVADLMDAGAVVRVHLSNFSSKLREFKNELHQAELDQRRKDNLYQEPIVETPKRRRKADSR